MPENRNRPALNRWHVVILVYICFIYGNSLTPASISSQESGFLLEKVRGAMESLGWEHLWLTEHIIRKTAHFAEYAVRLDMSGAAVGMAITAGVMCCLRKKRTVRQGGRE